MANNYNPTPAQVATIISEIFGIAIYRPVPERPAAALAALLFYEEAGGAADAAYLYETGRACLALGKRDEGGAYLSRALAAEPDTRKVRELMELIQ